MSRFSYGTGKNTVKLTCGKSPLDKLAARFISGLIKSRERQQRVARHHKALQDGAKAAAAAPAEEEDAAVEAECCSDLGMSGSESELSL